MLFQKRIDRAFRHQRGEKRPQDGEAPNRDDLQPAPSDLMEKGDLPAMILSALLLIVPVALVVLLLMAGVGWLFLLL